MSNNNQATSNRTDDGYTPDALDYACEHTENFFCPPRIDARTSSEVVPFSMDQTHRGKNQRKMKKKKKNNPFHEPEAKPQEPEKDGLDIFFEGTENVLCGHNHGEEEEEMAQERTMEENTQKAPSRQNSVASKKEEPHRFTEIQEKSSISSVAKKSTSTESADDGTLDAEWMDSSPEEKSKKSRNICLLLVILICIIIAAVVGTLLATRKKRQRSSPKPTAIINDVCIEAELLQVDGDEELVVSASTSGASVTNPSIPTCAGINENGKGQWYTFIGDGNYYKASTCGDVTDFDSQISLFSGSSCDDLQCVDAEDNFCGEQAQVGWYAVPDVTYYILIHGHGSDVGTFQLTFGRHAFENKQCDVADLLDVTYDWIQVKASTKLIEAGNEVVSCNGSSTLNGLWYRFTGTGKLITLSTCNPGTDYPAEISIFTGTCGDLTCFDESNSVSNSVEYTYDNICEGQGTTVRFQTIAETEYFMLVHGSDDVPTFGDFELTSTNAQRTETCGTSLELVPDGSLEVGIVTDTSSLEGATDIGFEGACGDSVVGTYTRAWYRIRGTGNMISATTCDEFTLFDSQLSVFTGDCNQLQCITGASNDEQCSDPTRASVSWESTAGQDYYLMVHGDAVQNGVFRLRVSEN